MMSYTKVTVLQTPSAVNKSLRTLTLQRSCAVALLIAGSVVQWRLINHVVADAVVWRRYRAVVHWRQQSRGDAGFGRVAATSTSGGSSTTLALRTPTVYTVFPPFPWNTLYRTPSKVPIAQISCFEQIRGSTSFLLQQTRFAAEGGLSAAATRSESEKWGWLRQLHALLHCESSHWACERIYRSYRQTVTARQ